MKSCHKIWIRFRTRLALEKHVLVILLRETHVLVILLSKFKTKYWTLSDFGKKSTFKENSENLKSLCICKQISSTTFFSKQLYYLFPHGQFQRTQTFRLKSSCIYGQITLLYLILLPQMHNCELWQMRVVWKYAIMQPRSKVLLNQSTKSYVYFYVCLLVLTTPIKFITANEEARAG